MPEARVSRFPSATEYEAPHLSHPGAIEAVMPG
jgi:hypothetical protein